MGTRKKAPSRKPTNTREKSAPPRKPTKDDADEILQVPDAKAWSRWLASHHNNTNGVWLKLAKKGADLSTPTYAEAVEAALCWGWIDAKKRAFDDAASIQRFCPRRARSPWSRINREKAERLLESGEMKPPGLAEVERAKADGRWDNAYEPASTATVPDDLAAALAKNKQAAAFFATLKGANRFAILYRLQSAKKPETRARRLAHFVEMLARHETLH